MIPVQDALPGALADLLRRMPRSDGKIAFAWRASAGAALDRVTCIKLRDSGVLEVEVPDQRWRIEIERSMPVIRMRLETLLGPGSIGRVSIRVRPPAAM